MNMATTAAPQDLSVWGVRDIHGTLRVLLVPTGDTSRRLWQRPRGTLRRGGWLRRGGRLHAAAGYAGAAGYTRRLATPRRAWGMIPRTPCSCA